MVNIIIDKQKLHRIIQEAMRRVLNENKVKEEHSALIIAAEIASGKYMKTDIKIILEENHGNI